MVMMHKFLDYLYESSILSRNGLSIMQEFLRVCERNNELEDQIVCKLANYIKQLSASDCYDLSNRLLNHFKLLQNQNQPIISTYKQQSLPTPCFTEQRQNTFNPTLETNQDLEKPIKLQSSSAKFDDSQKRLDWKRRIQMNDKLKSLSSIVTKHQQRTSFKKIQSFSQNTIKSARQLSPSAMKMSNHIKQQLNSIFDQDEQKRKLIQNNTKQKLIDQKTLSRNSSIEDFKLRKNSISRNITSQNTLQKQQSPHKILSRNRSNLSISQNQNNTSQQYEYNSISQGSMMKSQSQQINFNSTTDNPIRNLKENLNKEIIEQNQQLKINSNDFRFNYLNLRESFKLIHEQLEADLITNQEAIQMIDSIKKKQYDQICTFKPQINKENQYYEKIKNRDIDNPFERLYKDGVEHKTNKSQILSHIKGCLEMKDCTFHPNIQKTTPKTSRNVKFSGTLNKFATFSKDSSNQSYL